MRDGWARRDGGERLADAGFENSYNTVTWLEGDGVDDSASVFHGKHMRNGWKNSGLPSV